MNFPYEIERSLRNERKRGPLRESLSPSIWYEFAFRRPREFVQCMRAKGNYEI